MDLITILLLGFAILTGATRLAMTEWTKYLEGTVYLAGIGFTLGAALGYSRFRPRLVGVFATVYSLFFISLFLGSTMARTIIWGERLISLLGRFLYSLELFLSNKPLDDSILFLSSMYVLFWVVGITAGYHLTRNGRPWIPLLIAGIALLLIEYYVELYLPQKHSAFYTTIFVLLSILLITQTNFLKSSHRWREEGIIVESETRYDIGRGAFTAALIVFIVAWNIPTVSRLLTPGTEERARLNTGWDKFATQFQNAVAPLSGPRVIEVNYSGSATFLTSGQPLSDAEIFTAKTTLPSSRSMAYYWRARSYDTYQGGQWESTITSIEKYTPGSGELPYSDWMGRSRAIVYITTKTNMKTVYIPGQPIMLSRPSDLIMARLSDETIDLNSITVDPVLRPGELYEARVSMATPTIEELRNAGTEYPQDILDRYLQLPRTLPSRIKTLAEKIAGDESTPFDQATAITNYLRQNITYAGAIQDTPAGKDPVDYFLFTSEQGFCQYYASAEVLLLRSLGIPARYATGYAQGEPDETRTNFIVREKDSHAWPEVYFPGIGWVEFEPTAILSPITRRSSTETIGELIPSLTGEEDAERITSREPEFPDGESTKKPSTKPSIPTQPVRFTWLTWLLLIFAVIIISSVAVYFYRRKFMSLFNWVTEQLQKRHLRVPAWIDHINAQKENQDKSEPVQPFPVRLRNLFEQYHLKIPKWLNRWILWSELSPLEKSFSNVSWALNRLGHEDDPTLTPAERIERLINVLPECKESAAVLLAEFERSTYSAHPGDPLQAQRAGKEIRKVSWKVWLSETFGQSESANR